MKRLLLVDISSFLHRAFNALPRLHNSQGMPTGAIYGVLNMLTNLEKNYPCTHRACVFDSKTPTFRHEAFPAYKAKRTETDTELKQQFAPAKTLIHALGWATVQMDGVEADDVIGTITHQAETQGFSVLIVTGDKDFAQLVTANVQLLDTMKQHTILDTQGVIEKFGVRPDQIVDYLALIGDESDNIPGIPKVGPKTAATWLKEYNTLDQLITHAATVKGKVGESLRAHLAFLPTARYLVTIQQQLTLPITIADLSIQPPNPSALAACFQTFEFTQYLNQLKAQQVRGQFETMHVTKITNTEALLASMDVLKTVTRFACACETSPTLDFENTKEEIDLFHIQLHRLALGFEQNGLYQVFIFVFATPTVMDLLTQSETATIGCDLTQFVTTCGFLFTDPQIQRLTFDAKKITHIFETVGLTLGTVHEDLLLKSYVLASHEEMRLTKIIKKYLNLDWDACTAAHDPLAVEVTSVQILDPLLEAQFSVAGQAKLAHVYREIELPLVRILYQMERTGVLLDSGYLYRFSQELAAQLHPLETQAHTLAGQKFNLNSSKQLQTILFETLGLPVLKKTPKGVPSTDEQVLQELSLQHALPEIILNYRSLFKIKSTYADKLPLMVNEKTKRIHTHYDQVGTVTGRLASRQPNLQNLPIRSQEGRKIRAAFIAPPHAVLLSTDYSQIELRIMAHLSQDAKLLDAFRQHQDVHCQTASEIFDKPLTAITPEERRYAKIINFGLIYGMSAHGVSRQLGLEFKEAQAYIDRYFERYPGVAAYMQRTREQAKTKGFVETVFGRRLWLPEMLHANYHVRQEAERAAINAPMQGTAADLIKLAMLAVQQQLESGGLRSRLIMQVHDELILEVPHDEQAQLEVALPQWMQGVAALSVPLIAEVKIL